MAMRATMKTRGTAGRKRSSSVTASRVPGACPVCSDPLTQGGRFQHIRERHPAYWRVFVVRVASPWAFIALMLTLAVTGAPAWSFMAVLFAFVALSLWARRRSITERQQPGLGLTRSQWLQGAGIGLILMALSFSAVAAALLLTR